MNRLDRLLKLLEEYDDLAVACIKCLDSECWQIILNELRREKGPTQTRTYRARLQEEELMKKQYHISDAGFGRGRLDVYHDGLKISSETLWSEELDAQAEHLEEQGYTQGYSQEEVDKAEAKFRYLQNNLIKGV